VPNRSRQPKKKKRKREGEAQRAAACHAHLRGVCSLGAACAYSHAAPPCASWAAGACHRGAHCADVHAGPPGRAAALPAALPPRAFSAEQAARFRQLVSGPASSASLGELRALVGPLVLPLQPGGAAEAAAAAAEAAAAHEREQALPVHASNCGCPACAAARPAGQEGEGQEEDEARRVASVLSASCVVAAPKSRAMWTAVLDAIRARRS